MRLLGLNRLANTGYSLLRRAAGKGDLFHRLRYGLLTIRRKEDLQFFSPVSGMHLES